MSAGSWRARVAAADPHAAQSRLLPAAPEAWFDVAGLHRHCCRLHFVLGALLRMAQQQSRGAVSVVSVMRLSFTKRHQWCFDRPPDRSRSARLCPQTARQSAAAAFGSGAVAVAPGAGTPTGEPAAAGEASG